jgi:2-keto-4-pentenoate hydratase
MQDLLGITGPISGVLLDDMIVEESDQIRYDQFIQPRAEAEIALRLGSDLAGPGVTTAQAIDAVDGVLAAIEIGDSRIADWRLKLVDSVADNASSGRLALGSRVTSATGLDLRLLGVLFYRNGVPIDSGAGAAALGQQAEHAGVGPAPRHGDSLSSCVVAGERADDGGLSWLPRKDSNL